VKTIIQMPRTMEQTEAPALLVVRGKDGFFPWGGKAEEILVNYRVQSDRYIRLVPNAFTACNTVIQ
jgi:type IV secretion system protein VirB9